jgi:hypothetical protein
VRIARAGLVKIARATLAALGLAALGCDLGPLGATRLRGELASEPVTDWSFAADRYAIEIETEAPALLPAATTWFVVHEGRLWLYTLLPPPLETPWVRRLREEDPGVRIRVDGKLHAGRAVWVSDPALLEPLLPGVLRKYHLVETPRARFATAPERHPGTQIGHVFFRVDPP